MKESKRPRILTVTAQVILILLACGTARGAAPGQPRVKPVPRGLGLDPFYGKYLDAGFPICSSKKVSDYALLEAGYLVGKMLANRPDIVAKMRELNLRCVVMGVREFTTDIPEYAHRRPASFWDRRGRGYGPGGDNPIVSCAEENLLCYPGDPWGVENIFIHEFAHAIHWTLKQMKGGFDETLKKTYEKAVAAGRWRGTYAGTNRAEYWAEGVQSWFDTNRENDHDHNDVDTREELLAYDPAMAALIRETLGDTPWRYRRPADRDAPGHLAGYDPEDTPRFAWPGRLKQWWVAEKDSLLSSLDVAQIDEARSTSSQQKTDIFMLNKARKPLRVYWIDFDGKRRLKTVLPPGGTFHNGTFTTHPWLVTDTNDEPVGLYLPEKERYIVVLRPAGKK